MDVGLLVLRVVVGGLFVGHGLQKLFGWFGGYGIEGTAGFMSSLRYRQPKLAALGTGVIETGAGLFLAAGFLTPLVGAAIIGVMLNAIVSAKWPQGLYGGYELDLTFASAAAALAFTGAGAYSVDRVLGWDLGGIAWGLFALALGTVAGLVVMASRTPAVPVPAAAEEGADTRRAA